MPGSHFNSTLNLTGDRIRVWGPLEPENVPGEGTVNVEATTLGPPSEQIVFAFVTQPPDGSEQNRTVAGEARVRPDGAGKLPETWSFEVDREGLQAGAAFGTAFLVSFEADGTIETFGWSGWITIVDH